MFESQFESEFSSVREKIKNAQGSYNFKTGKEAWENIGTNPLDVAFTELTQLYLRADDHQRSVIYDTITNDPSAYDLWCFIRRVGKQICSKEDTRWLELGVVAAQIARGDFRDLIASLVLLKFSAELHGIDAKPFFDRALQGADEKIVSVLKSARDHEEKDVHFIVQNSGEPEWVAESVKKYGEHPTMIEMKKIQEAKMRNLQEGKKQMTTWLRSMIIFIVVFGLIALWNYIRTFMGR